MAKPDARSRVKRAWKKSGLTKTAFAERIGVSMRTLESWMRDPKTDKSARTPRDIYVREAEKIAAAAELAAVASMIDR